MARKSKTPALKIAEQPPEPARTKEEEALAARYERDVLAGSLSPAGAYSEFGKKRTLVIRCGACGEPRRLATSDLWQCRYCPSCTKANRRAARKSKAAE